MTNTKGKKRGRKKLVEKKFVEAKVHFYVKLFMYKVHKSKLY